MKRLTILLSVAVLLCGAGSASAVAFNQVTPDGAGDYLWGEGSNWGGGTVPLSTDRATIWGVATVKGAHSILSIDVGRETDLGLPQGLTIAPTGSLTLTGNYSSVTMGHKDGIRPTTLTIDGGSMVLDEAKVYLKYDSELIIKNGGSLIPLGGSRRSALPMWYVDRSGLDEGGGTLVLDGANTVVINDELLQGSRTIKFTGNAVTTVKTHGDDQVGKWVVDVANGATIDISGLNVPAGTYRLFEGGGTTYKWPLVTDMALMNFVGSNFVSYDYSRGNYLDVTVIPEPATLAVLGLGGLGLLLRRKR
ncbi:MAG: PEP-CTERM sorting domain-containing protein [Planctomycetota bacterium]